MISLELRCGHVMQVEPAKAGAPVTCFCGETRVRRTNAPPPRFVGHVRGPRAVPENLPAIAVDLTTRSRTEEQ